jgi:hypothetical protein
VSVGEKSNLPSVERKLEEDIVCAENCEACKNVMILICLAY